MARLRGRSIKVSVDLPQEIDDPADVAEYVLAALEEHGGSLRPDEPLHGGMRVRTVTFDGETFEV